MAPSRWDPFREIASLQEGLDRMFRDIEGTRREKHFMSSHWTPPVDILRWAMPSFSSWTFRKWIKTVLISSSMTMS